MLYSSLATVSSGMEEAFQLTLANGHYAAAIRVHRSDDLAATLRTIGLAKAAPTVVIVGGASGMSPESLNQLQALFVEALAPLAHRLNARVVDGGTDAGVMKLIGQARYDTASTFSLIGVAAIGTVDLPNGPVPPCSDSAPLEPHHTHFLLVPGELWGDEAPWIARIAGVLSSNEPSITLLINGGKIAWQDVYNSVRANRPVVVVGGSGRTADELAAAIRGEARSERTEELIKSGLLKLVHLDDGPQAIAQSLAQWLTVPSTSNS